MTMRARAAVVAKRWATGHGKGALILDGPCRGTTFALDDPDARVGETVEVEFNPEDQFAQAMRYLNRED